ncbi:P-II family nitrogen regulator [Proteocatella sphenisci]|uniref:P-II family nitrogen regulator n=1 Tax=Proteocatella sphenisci TaxID=181070 RepID=UPI00048C6C8F|nr:P-II family nitrogen regulator [Proteocatella sphenisci]
MELNRFDFDMNVVIVKCGMGSKVLSIARSSGICGGTIIIGRGTVKNAFLKFFELDQSRKEIVMVISNRKSGCSFLEKIYKELKLDKQGNGIAFSIPVINVIGTKHCMGDEEQDCKGDNKMFLYNSIFVIVERGNAQTVVDVANDAGARGATIINARGAGVHETQKIFAIEIEPEKEIVLLLVDSAKTEKVCEHISNQLELEEPGKGIMFVQGVNKVYGLY